MESFRLVRTFYHCLAEIGSLYKTYGSRERVSPPLVVRCNIDDWAKALFIWEGVMIYICASHYPLGVIVVDLDSYESCCYEFVNKQELIIPLWHLLYKLLIQIYNCRFTYTYMKNDKILHVTFCNLRISVIIWSYWTCNALEFSLLRAMVVCVKAC